jgi:hypothetical protein
MTIGAAPMTRVLSTAAVVHAMEKKSLIISEGKKEIYLSIHAKNEQ